MGRQARFLMQRQSPFPGEASGASSMMDSSSSFTAEDEVIEANRRPRKEKEQINDEIALGVVCADHLVEESPDLIQHKTEQFQDWIDYFMYDDKQAYLEALERCPGVVETESNPLFFLRATNFDPEKAARKCVQNWQARKRIFGDDRAFLPMKLGQAISEADMEMLRDMPYSVCLAPSKDVYGRNIICVRRDGSDIPKYGPLTLIRLIWYMNTVALFEENAQQEQQQRASNQKRKHHGMVYLSQLDLYKSMLQIDRTQIRALVETVSTFPLKAISIHTCVGSAMGTMVVQAAKAFLCVSPELRARFVVHDSRVMEDTNLLEDLQNYGIYPGNVPVTMGGGFEVDVPGFLERRSEIEGTNGGGP